jgi:YVTN family beta-propeller protein
MAADDKGALYIADTGNNRIRKLDSSGTIATLAGAGESGFAGDGSLASAARMVRPFGVALAPGGITYIADTGNNRIRKVVSSTTYSALSSASSQPASASSPQMTAGNAAVNVYEAIKSGFAPGVAGIPERVYVPNEGAGTVNVIDPATFTIVDRLTVGKTPQHITPGWDMKSLLVNNMDSNSLTEIDPVSGKPRGTIPIPYPYNLYFTVDGTRAVVVAESLDRLDFYDRTSWRLLKSLPIPWEGVNHMDMTADGRYLLTTTEFDGFVVKVDTVTMTIAGQAEVGGLPIDVRLAPDGSVFYVTNQSRDGVSIIDPIAMKELAFIPTGRGAHGLVVSRDTQSLYVSNRLEGSISVIDFGSRRVRAKWMTGGSPDMLQVSADGRQLWASSRFHSRVDVIDTTTGAVLRQIRTDYGPHGLTYFPQPGRISLGHNGVYR